MKVMARPRTRSLTAAGSSRRRSRLLKSTSPPRIRAEPAGRTPRIARASVVLPQPLSPTSPTTSPGATSRLMRSSTCATPWSVTKSTSSRRTESNSAIAGTLAPAEARVEHVAEAVAEQVEAHDGEEDGEPGRGGVPPCGREELARLRDRSAPLRRRWRRPESEKAQRGSREHREPHADRCAHDDRRRDVRQHVQCGQAPRRRTERGGALDEHFLLERARLGV